VRVAIGNPDSPNHIVRSVPIVNNFSEIGGGLGLVIDSFGMLALCTDRGSAAAELDLGPTNMVTISKDPTAGGGVSTTVRLGSKPN